MAERRKRRPNFTAEEKNKLMGILTPHKHVIMNRLADGSSNEAKNNAWIEITNIFNSNATVYRSKHSLIKMWDKMRTDSNYMSAMNIPSEDFSPLETRADSLSDQGSGCSDPFCINRNVDFDMESTNAWINNNNSLSYDSNSQSSENEEMPDQVRLRRNMLSRMVATIQSNRLGRTPLWARRRRQTSDTNRRDPTSQLNANRNREEIEHLKKQLLLEQILFKRKLYLLQLQAAAQDVEIKSAVLAQIEGGGIDGSDLIDGNQID